MLPSLHNSLRDLLSFSKRTKTSEFFLGGWFKVNTAATVLWFVTCYKVKDIFHSPPLRKTGRYKQVRNFLMWFRMKLFFSFLEDDNRGIISLNSRGDGMYLTPASLMLLLEVMCTTIWNWSFFGNLSFYTLLITKTC